MIGNACWALDLPPIKVGEFATGNSIFADRPIPADRTGPSPQFSYHRQPSLSQETPQVILLRIRSLGAC